MKNARRPFRLVLMLLAALAALSVERPAAAGFIASDLASGGSYSSISEYHSGADQVSILLIANSGGLPGATLATTTLANIPVGPSMVSAVPSANILLVPGTNHWLAAVASNDTSLTWMMDNQGPSNDMVYRVNHGSGPQGRQPASGSVGVAFSVSAVPSPPSSVSFGIGLMSVGGYLAARSRRRG